MTQSRKNIAWGASMFFCSYLMFFLIFSIFAPYAMCYMEQLGTAIWSRQLLLPMLCRPGGVSTVLSLAVVQLFVEPGLSIVIASAILACISWLLGCYYRKLSKSWSIAPLGIIPAMALGFLLLNVDFHFSSAIAFLLMSLSLLAQMMVKNGYRRLAVTFLLSIALYLLAGPVALLYACIVLVQQLLIKGKPIVQSLWYICCVLAVLGLAHYSIMSGYVSEWQHAVLPMGYFTQRLQGGNILLMPWIFVIAIVGLSGLSSYVKLSSKYAILSAAISAGFVVWGIFAMIDRDNETFKALNCLARKEEWAQIEKVCESLPMHNLLFQNMRSMALAEQGTLGDKLFHKPALDIRTIYPIGEKSPYIYMVLSDIYYSMGHISLAQRYAFEANESLGNMSPRMLQRLTDTNLITAQYAVADKYLRMLEHACMYKEWTAQRRSQLADSAICNSLELAAKCSCIFPDNRFAGVKGLDDDLAQICRTNSTHTPTMQYLGCLYLLSKDLSKFKVAIDELWDKRKPLPVNFQEALAMLPDSVAANYEISQDVKERWVQFQHSPRTQPYTYWHFWKYVK